MRRTRVFFVTIVAAAAMATTADAATVGVPGGPSVQVPNVGVPQLSPPSLPKVQAPKAQSPQVRLPSVPNGAEGPVQRLGGSVPGGGTAGGGSGAAGSGAAGSSEGGPAGSSSGSSQAADGPLGNTARGSGQRPLSAGQRRARDARERRTLLRSVGRLRGCLGVVSSFERDVLVLRAGVSGPELSRAQVAQALDTNVGRVHRGERSGLRGLRDAARSTGCAGGTAMSFSSSESDQMTAATVAVATGAAPSLRPLATMARSDDSQLVSVRARRAGQVIDTGPDSGVASSSGERPLLSAEPASVSVGGTNGSPLLLFSLFLLLLLLVPLTPVALRRRPTAAGPEPASAPAPGPVPAAVAPPAPHSTPPPPPKAPAEPEAERWAEPRDDPQPEPIAVPPTRQPAPGSQPRSLGRGHAVVAALASALASVAVGSLISRRFRGRRRR